jgi:hypothetical protein
MTREPDAIRAYVRELERQLRVPLWRRRRIVSEVREHLREAAAAERADAHDETVAAARALARFGPASATARELNRLPAARTVTLRRALAPWLVAAALTGSGAASVWAFQPGEAPKRAHASRVAKRSDAGARPSKPRCENATRPAGARGAGTHDEIERARRCATRAAAREAASR